MGPRCNFSPPSSAKQQPPADTTASVRWDEANLSANDAESLAANRQQILEPKTPFHYLAEDGEPAAFPPKAAAAVAGPRPAQSPDRSSSQNKQLEVGVHDLAALTDSALQRRVTAAETPVIRAHLPPLPPGSSQSPRSHVHGMPARSTQPPPCSSCDRRRMRQLPTQRSAASLMSIARSITRLVDSPCYVPKCRPSSHDSPRTYTRPGTLRPPHHRPAPPRSRLFPSPSTPRQPCTPADTMPNQSLSIPHPLSSAFPSLSSAHTRIASC